MLKTLDVVIGLSVVMLLVSMAVTVLTQFVVGMRNWRGKHLLEGIEAILTQIDPNLKEHATDIGKAVLTHKLIGPLTGKLGGVVTREELVRVLMELAAGTGVGQDPKSGKWNSLMLALSGEEGPKALANEAKTALSAALTRAGINQPDQVLDNIYSAALKLEATNPELSAAVRHTTAIIQEAPGIFVARINSWFDHTMNRVTESFVYSTRKVTAVCGLLLAVGLQLDTIDLLKKLSTDDELRKAVVGQAASVMAAYDKEAAHTDADKAALSQAKLRLKEFSVTGYDLWPSDWPDKWWDDWSNHKLPGILLTTLLLSLGAPFWYNALKNLVNLRPLLAGKDDAARAERSSDQSGPTSTTGPPPALTSEQGNLSAAG